MRPGKYLEGLRQCLDEIGRQENALEKAAGTIFSAYRQGHQVFVMGNGGSATTASHCALGFEKQSSVPGKPRLKCKSLTDSLALISAWANDEDYSSVFVEQLKNHLEKGDVVIAFSASGSSPNLLKAFEYARDNGGATIAFTGCDGGKLRNLADQCLSLSCRDYGQIEDAHLAISHILSEMLKEKIESV